MTDVVAITMSIWSDCHASACNPCVVSTVLCALELRSRSLATAADFMCIIVISRPTVIVQSPSPNTPSVKALEVRKGVTKIPCCLHLCQQYFSADISFVHGAKQTIFEKRSTNMAIVIFPSISRKFITKSIVICCHFYFSSGIGCSTPACFLCLISLAGRLDRIAHILP